MTKKTPVKNSEAHDILHDLDAMPDTRGKEWSINLARKLGLTPEQIEEYMGKREK